MTSEELATILREELPGWEVNPGQNTSPSARAHRRGWDIDVHDGYSRAPTVYITLPAPENTDDDIRIPVYWLDGSVDPREYVRAAIIRARTWVAALQAGCP